MASSWLAPACLIEPNARSLKCLEETAKKISAIDKSLIIICISGPLRQGKSYLMNRLAKYFLAKNGRTSASSDFVVSSARIPATKGFWVWYVDHPNDKEKGILIVDIEGLGDNASKAYDNCLLCLALLLGSVFVYNVSSDTIDSPLIDKLDFVKVSEHIHQQSHPKNGTLYDDPFPVLVISLRNVGLDDEGETDDQYMEKRLRQLTVDSYDTEYVVFNAANEVSADECCSESDASNAGNYVSEELNINVDGGKIKRLTDYFITRKCFMFPLPTQNTDEMKKTHKLSDDKLTPAFVQKLNDFCYYVSSTAPVKMLHQKPINGKILIDLLREYLQHIDKSGSVVRFGDDVGVIIDNNNKFFAEKSIGIFTDEMNGCIKKEFPVTMVQLKKATLPCIEKAVNYYVEKAYHDGKKECYENLKNKLIKEFDKYEALNRKESSELYMDVLRKLYAHHRNLLTVREEFEKVRCSGVTKIVDWCVFSLTILSGRCSNHNQMASSYQLSLQEKLDEAQDQLDTEYNKIVKSIQDKISKLISKEYEEKQNQVKKEYGSRITELESEKKKLEKEGKLEEAKLVQREIDGLKSKQKSYIQSIIDAFSMISNFILKLFSSR